MPTASPALITIAQQTQTAAHAAALLSSAARNEAIEAIAQALEQSTEAIFAANIQDCKAALGNGISPALYSRLKLGESKLRSAIEGVRSVAELPDPLGQLQLHRELDDGLILRRVTCPVGVLGVIFEARPDAVMQIASLAIKSGNGAILKGGKEAIHTCQGIVAAIHQALANTAVSPQVIQLLTTRAETVELLQLKEYVNLIIPRGSNAFVQFVQQNTEIPVLGHADGICHVYLDRTADLDKAIQIAVDAKTQYPAGCNSMETLLVHSDLLESHLSAVLDALRGQSVVLKGDDRVQACARDVKPALEADWSTEYSDLVLSIRVVDSLEAAIDHINTYGSHHTDAIVTEDQTAAAQFLAQVNSAGVYHNCSTRFADGFRYGFGAEVGISTQMLPPRGPVGLEGLVTYKYQLVGNGHIAGTYSGDGAKAFTHRDLPTLESEI
ncbi:MAG: glutamate-5-semialdehyde dehydrogenase [Prochlorotrichaceae cyanobacterium]